MIRWLVSRFRKAFKKWLYNSCPGFSGSFPYFGTTLFFPKDDCLFLKACDDGIYEPDTFRALVTYVKPKTTFIDIGANIGLMSAALADTSPDSSVVSVEPSPSVNAFLSKTIAGSIHRSHWRHFECGLSDRSGTLPFSSPPPALSAFGGFVDTARVKGSKTIEVQVRTLDEIWAEIQCPAVSVIKCDTEGHEAAVLEGGMNCINQCRPVIVLEWNSQNLRASGCRVEWLIDFAEESNYEIRTIPGAIPVETPLSLRLVMEALLVENFILLPKSNCLASPAIKRNG